MRRLRVRAGGAGDHHVVQRLLGATFGDLGRVLLKIDGQVTIGQPGIARASFYTKTKTTFVFGW